MKSIECNLGFGQSNVNYVHYGTIGYFKGADGNVRMAKCLGCRWVANERGSSFARHTWKVAGIKEPLVGNAAFVSGSISGIIYATEDAAQHGTANHKEPTRNGIIETNSQLSVHGLMMRKYGFDIKSFDMRGTWNNFLQVKGYYQKEDGTINYKALDFNLYTDEKGEHVDIADIDNKVAYSTIQAAKDSRPKKKVITFDDEDFAKEAPKPKMLKVVINISEDKIKELSAIGTIVGKVM